MRSDGDTSTRRLPPRAPWVAGLLALGLLFAAGCGERGAAAPTGPVRGARPVPVLVAPVASTTLSHRVEGTGSLEAYQVVTVAARVEGVVESVAFDEGDPVDPTKDLAVIDGKRKALEQVAAQAAVLEASAAGPRAAAAVTRAAAGEERAQAQARAARTDLRESEEMLARREGASPGVVPGEEIATMRAQAARKRDALAVAEAASREAVSAQAEARAQEAEASAALATATARLALATKLVADTVVRSPLKGVVRRRHVTLGQYVRAGDPIAELVDRSRLRLRFRVNEAESTRLATGLPLTFLVPAISPMRYRGRLVHVDEAASPVSRMVECLGEVEDPAPSLKPGFFVTATVETRSAPGIAIPEEALLPSEQGWIVFVVEGSKASRRLVSIGLRTQDGRAEVLDGLQGGESLVVRGANVLSDGVPVSAAPLPPAGASPPPSGTPATPR